MAKDDLPQAPFLAKGRFFAAFCAARPGLDAPDGFCRRFVVGFLSGVYAAKKIPIENAREQAK